MEVKGKILAKKSDNKAFKLDDDNWYNLNDPVIPYLEKMSKGDEIVVTFEKKGVSRYVSKLVSASETPKTTQKESSTDFVCEVCGKTLKDGKFKKCYECNKSGATKKEEPTTSEFKCEDCGATLKNDKYKKCFACGKKSFGKGKGTSYDSPEKAAQIQKESALKSAASVASNQQFADPGTAQQFTLMLADSFLEWLIGEIKEDK